MKRILSSLLISCFLTSTLFAQTYVEMMQDPNANFYDVVAEFETYWANRPQEKGKGYKVFKRWQEFMAPRVYPSGDMKQASRAYEEFQSYLQANPGALSGPRAGNWSDMGPTGAPAYGGAGRINFVRFHPTNNNILYAGSPGGGLWFTLDGGVSWNTNTDQLAVIGCTDIAINPLNPSTMYLATGDGDAGDTYSIGVLKSTDGGNSWNTTGLSWTVNQGRTISKLLIHPTNPQVLIAATSNGIYRTSDAGVSWTQVQNTNAFKDMEFKPGDPNTVYASGTTFWKSINGGASWTQVTNGLPTTNVGRYAIAVTPANANYVYVLAARNSDSGLLGVYRSTDSGTNFSTRSTSPNYLGYNASGSDAGGQGWYDLAIAASPTNAEVVIVGGINIWRSANGGSSFSINGHWTGSGAPYVHADIHDLIFLPGSGTTYFAGCDGGVFKTTNSGGAWTDISADMQIAQQYRVGLSASNANLLVTGHQDNGTNKMNGTTWTQIYGGDGMDCFIDRTNNNTIFASYVYGDFQRSTNGGGTWTNIVSGLSGNPGWLAPWHQDPVTATTLYAGYSNVFRSTNSGTSWTQISSFSGSGEIVELDIAPSNNQVIYAVRSNAVFKTTNGGGAWTNITGTLPVASAAITYVEISPTDPNRVYVTFSGYSSANKVFVSTNGGSSWTNYSTGLPNLPVNCIVYQNSTTDGVYIGTDVGVYYRDASLSSWVAFTSGLPNVVVRDLEIYYPTLKIRAATYGRGTWESDLYSPGSLTPVADFSADKINICPGQVVNFTDLSAGNPNAWSWTFTGGTPATSTVQHPTVTYASAGTYAVTLTASNANGNDTETKTAYITVSNSIALPLTEGFQGSFVPAGWHNNDVSADNIKWEVNTTEGGFGTSTSSAWFDNYNNDVGGTRDELWTPKYDFNGYSSVTMTFDVAYARYNATYSDTLAVLVSGDCGQTFSQVFLKGGNTLSTNGGTDANPGMFSPTNTQWRTETISLNSFIGSSEVVVVFQNRGRYGQPIYLDNINISGVVASTPLAGFTASPTTVCAGQSVSFTNTSSNASSYAWTFPGGTPASSTATNPTVSYNTPGVYDVTLTATGNGTNTLTQTTFITVNAIPATTATSNSPLCEGGTINLSASSVAGATFSWSGPNGFTSSQQNPVIASASTAMSGTYTVTVTLNGCSSTSSTTVLVQANPTATAASNSPVCTGSVLNLTANTVSGASYAWSGPVGYTSSAEDPSRPSATTAMSGTYTLTVTSSAGCTATSSTSVTVNSNPTATAGSNSPLCSGNTLNLTSNTVAGASYAWSGPSGYTSTTEDPSRPNSTTAMSGTYTLTITSSNGCSATSNVSVVVNATPTATAGSNSPLCAGANLNLTANTVSGASYAWSGPGGYTSTSEDPTRTSSTTGMSGTYTVTITSPAGCSASSSTTVAISTPPTATAGSNSPLCSGNTLNLTSNTVAGASYAWSGPSGYTSTTEDPSRPNSTTAMSGNYTLTITSGACSSTSTIAVTVNATPSATASSNSPICAGQTLNLSTPAVSGASYSWSGPSGYTATVRTPSRTNATTAMSGTYTVTVTRNGCSSSSSVTVVVNTTPIASATSNSPACSGQNIELNAATVSGASYSWTGPNGFSSALQNPTISSATGAMAGTYTLTVNNGCTATSTTVLVVNATPQSTASNNGPLCEGENLQLSATTAGSASYSWSGPNGFSSVNQNENIPASSLADAGTYTLTVTENLCSSTSSTTVIVNSTPIADAGSDVSICEGNSSTLNASGGSDYLWSPTTGLSNASVFNPDATPSVTTSYTVTVTDANGCTDSDLITVTVESAITADAGADVSICEGDNTQLNVSTTGSAFLWSPATGLDDPTVADPVAAPLVSTSYTVTVSSGNCVATDVVTVTVNPAPSSPIITLSGTDLVASGNGTYQWYLDGNLIPGAISQSITPPQNGVYSVVLTDANGCSSESDSPFNFTGYVGIANEINATYLHIYPNPADGIFQLEVKAPWNGTYILEIVNALGQLVYSETIQLQYNEIVRKEIDASTIERGIYTLRISGENNNAVKRIVLQ